MEATVYQACLKSKEVRLACVGFLSTCDFNFKLTYRQRVWFIQMIKSADDCAALMVSNHTVLF